MHRTMTSAARAYVCGCVAYMCLAQTPQAAGFRTDNSRNAFVVVAPYYGAALRRQCMTGHRTPAVSRHTMSSSKPDVQDAASQPWNEHVSPIKETPQTGCGARRRFKPGDVMRVRPSADNCWHENRVTMQRESTFIHALMVTFPFVVRLPPCFCISFLRARVRALLMHAV